MMRKQKSLMTRIGDAMEAAKDKTQEVGVSLIRKVEVAASSASREAGKTRTVVRRKARAAKASVKRKAKAVEADAKKAYGKAQRTVRARPGRSKPMRRGPWAKRSAR